MKKWLVILLAAFYLILVSGLNVSLHYCGGKLKTISLFNNGNENGCCGTKEKSKGCCNERSAFVKVKDNHFGNDHVKILNSPVKSLPAMVFQQRFLVPDAEISDIVLNYYAPPVLYGNPRYLKYRVLII